MIISDNEWAAVKKSMYDSKLAFINKKYDAALNMAEKVTSEIVNISIKMDSTDNRQNTKLLDVATYVATQLDIIANSIGDENMRHSIIEYRNSMVETVRPIAIRYIDKALALYQYITIICESGNSIDIPEDAYNSASELQEPLKMLRNYWAA